MIQLNNFLTKLELKSLPMKKEQELLKSGLIRKIGKIKFISEFGVYKLMEDGTVDYDSATEIIDDNFLFIADNIHETDLYYYIDFKNIGCTKHFNLMIEKIFLYFHDSSYEIKPLFILGLGSVFQTLHDYTKQYIQPFNSFIKCCNFKDEPNAFCTDIFKNKDTLIINPKGFISHYISDFFNKDYMIKNDILLKDELGYEDIFVDYQYLMALYDLIGNKLDD